MKTAIAILILAAVPALAQTITPVISEYGRKASGAFTVRNDSLKPQSVTIQPMSFSVNQNQHPEFRPLDATVHLTLSEMSARVGAGQQHSFSYQVTCDTLPCPVALLASVSGPHAPNGLVIRLVLAHIVYLCDRQKDCRASVLRAAAGGKQQ